MNIKIHSIILSIIFAFSGYSTAIAQDQAAEGAIPQISAEQMPMHPVIESALQTYSPWKSAEFSGKLRYEKLPLSPTVKIYMERDSLIQLSIRAPFVGEVGRIEADTQTIFAVNKLKGVYCRESMENLMKMYPGIISDIQSILLARVVLLGEGELDHLNYINFAVQEDPQGDYLLIAENEEESSALRYGYLISQAGRTLGLVATIPSRNIDLQVDYSYPDRGEKINFTLNLRGRQTSAQLDFNSVKWGGSRISAINTAKYRQVSLSDFLKSFR